MIESLRSISTWRIERRPKPGGAVRYRLGSVAIGVILSTTFALVVSGASSSAFFNGLWNSTLGTPYGVQYLAILATPLLLTGLAAAIPLRIGLWNIGGNGQLFLGAWAAFAVGERFPDMKATFLIPLMFVAAAAGGAAWALLPALARVYLGVNEIISTLMFNFIAGFWVLYWAGQRWPEPLSAGGVKSRVVPEQTVLQPAHIGEYLIPLGFLIALAVVAVIWLFLRGSVFGYEMSIIGSSPRAATYAGMPTRRITVTVFLLGGAAAGLAGVIEMLGNIQRFAPALSNNVGYTGVVVAVLAGGLGLDLVAMALVFAAITIGGNVLSITGASSDLVFAMYGLTLICAAIGQGLRHLKLVRTSHAAEDDTAAELPAEASV